MKRSQISTYCFAVFLLGVCNMAQSVEEPKYTLIGTIGKVEFRHYDAVIQARTTLVNSGETSAGFRRLAGFIFGGNDAEQKIAMTAPVQETIAKEQVELAFTMPGEYSLETLPAPNDPTVSLTHVPARTVAVISFSGWATPAKVQRYQQQLVEYLESQEIASVAAPMLNQYNPPLDAAISAQERNNAGNR